MFYYETYGEAGVRTERKKMSRERIWYGIEYLDLDNEGFTKAIEFNHGISRIVSEELDIKNSRIVLLVRYTTWVNE